VFEGGCSHQGREILAETGKSILTELIPDFLVELGKMVLSQNTTYDKWILTHHRQLRELIDKYAA